MATHEEIKNAYETYILENEKFTQKGIKSSSTRARNALSTLAKLCKERRMEISKEKEEMSK